MPRKKNAPKKPISNRKLKKMSATEIKRHFHRTQSILAAYKKRRNPDTGKLPRRHNGWTYGGLIEQLGRTFCAYTDKEDARSDKFELF